MKYPELRRLSKKMYFTCDDVAEVLDIQPGSARVLCARYTNRGLLIRLKKNLYCTQERWLRNSQVDFYRIANILQVPSYVSLMSALAFYEITTQVQRNTIESVCIKRSDKREIEGMTFVFYKIKRELYSDFLRINDFFIATKEKAFLDAVYLYSFGKYAFDIASLDIEKMDKAELKRLSERYPQKTKRILKQICGI